MSESISEAWDARRYEEVERLIDEMWSDSPPHVQAQLLSTRVRLYRQTGQPELAAAASAELAALKETNR